MKAVWLRELATFFDASSKAVDGSALTMQELCRVSGRDPRLWESKLYEDLIESIIEQLDVENGHHLLEVGCASGFLAVGLSLHVGQYMGIDLSKNAIKVANQLKLKNASFRQANATQLPFDAETFDRVICYDVMTNIPNLDFCAEMIGEMVRVVRPGGKIMVGSLADRSKEVEYGKVVQEVGAELDREKGPLQFPMVQQSTWDRLKSRLMNWKNIEPRITCYYFQREDFLKIGKRFGVCADLYDIHLLNPYRGFRFNVVYTKAS